MANSRNPASEFGIRYGRKVNICSEDALLSFLERASELDLFAILQSSSFLVRRYTTKIYYSISIPPLVHAALALQDPPTHNQAPASLYYDDISTLTKRNG